MNTILWILQGMLAVMFGAAGWLKSSLSVEELGKVHPWVKRFSVKTISLIGVLEILASVGLIVPCLLNVVPELTPMAALGISLIQLLAIYHHAKHREGRAITFSVLMFAAAVFIAVGRY